MNDYQKGAANERERIAKFIETHSIDWDCSVLVWDEDDYDEDYCNGSNDPHDDLKAKACQRKILAEIIRGNITTT